MTFWSQIKDFFGGKRAAPPADDSLEGVHWVSASDSPFGVDMLDCRGFSQSVVAATQDAAISSRFVALRTSKGEEYCGRTPTDSIRCACALRYPHTGDTANGPLFKAHAMEFKWDIYLYDGSLYFVRSWTGELAYRATIQFSDSQATVSAVEAQQALVESDSAYAIAVVDYLIRSHIYGLPVPHPLPKSMGRDARVMALFSFSQYGRFALFATHADTTHLVVPSHGRPDGADA